MDEIFQDIHGIRGALDVVKVANTKPRRFGKNGELLISYQETEAYRRRRSSVAAPTEGRKTEGETQHDEEKASDSSGH